MSSVVALIPSRAGSKRLPNKGTKLLGGRSLISWTIEAAQKSGVYDRIVVCSDDPRCLELGADVGADSFERHLVPDTQADLEWILEAQAEGFLDGHNTFSLLRPTSPFRSAETICRAWDTWCKVRDDVDSLRAVRKVSESPAKMWEISYDTMDPLAIRLWPSEWANSLAPFPQPWNRPTQGLGDFFIQTAGLEIAHSRVLAEGSISGDRIAPFVLEGPASLDVNTLSDFWIAERYLAEGIVK